MHNMITAAGGPIIRCGSYARRDVQKRASSAGGPAPLPAHHLRGDRLRGKSQDSWQMCETEVLVRQFLMARRAGSSVVLPDDVILRVEEKFKSYKPREKGNGIRRPTASHASRL